MWPTDPRLLVVGALLLGGAPAGAQVTVVPESLRIVVPQGGEVTAAVTLTNGGPAALPFCLDFDQPLQRSGNGVLGTGCGPPGELLLLREIGADPYSLTMTPDGRLFVANRSSAYRTTMELDASLNLVRTFTHPTVAELTPFPTTVGVTFDEHSGTLWWTNAEASGLDLRRVMLLEGTLDGVATGRRITLPGVGGFPPAPYPQGAAYDAATRLFYLVDFRNDSLWAVDSLGRMAEGYPRHLERYPTAGLGNALDAHGGRPAVRRGCAWRCRLHYRARGGGVG